MTGRIAIFSHGLWCMRADVAALTGMSPQRAWTGWLPRGTTAVAGWGHKPTAWAARRAAEHSGLPYIAFEDGFLRSVRPGPNEPPQSLIIDHTGIYYDARQPSDLEHRLNAMPDLTAEQSGQASQILGELRRLRLSKYNDAPPYGDFPLPAQDKRATVMVVDQTRGDASIEGAMADGSTFASMLDAAIRENPSARILVKLHPETLAGQKAGYLANAAVHPEVQVTAEPVNPWVMFDGLTKVYTVSSQLGFEALMAGCEVVCFGVPFYAGWGLTDDRHRAPRRGRHLRLEQLVHAVYVDYCRYLCTWTRKPVDVLTALDQLRFRRDFFHDRPTRVVCTGISAWKRPVVRAMLTGRGGPPVFAGRDPAAAFAQAKKIDAGLAAWGRKAGTLRNGASGLEPIYTIEDGLLRSVGLGAGFTRPLSLVFDRRGIYYDPARPSDLEDLLQNAQFSEQELSEARALRNVIVSSHLTKYNLGATRLPDLPEGRPIVLVPGQVADDESIRHGARDLAQSEPLARGGANLALLKRVRQRNPDGFIIYKPHPDVEAGFRAGKIFDEDVNALADLVFREGAITGLFDRITALETATSLAGFEALLRGLQVVTHGCPFYAGWGLTSDLAPCARRTRRRNLDELVAASLLRYPVYVTPSGNMPCPPLIAAQLLVAEREKIPGMAFRTQAWMKKTFAKFRYTTINLFGVNSDL